MTKQRGLVDLISEKNREYSQIMGLMETLNPLKDKPLDIVDINNIFGAYKVLCQLQGYLKLYTEQFDTQSARETYKVISMQVIDYENRTFDIFKGHFSKQKACA